MWHRHRPDPHLARRHPHLEGGDKIKLGWQCGKCQSRSDRLQGNVIMGGGSAEGGIEIAALVARRDLDDQPIVRGDHLLNPLDEVVKLGARSFVTVKGDAAELDEEGRHRAEFGKKFALAQADFFEDVRQQPGPRLVFTNGVRRKCWPGLRGYRSNCFLMLARRPYFRVPYAFIATSPPASACSLT